jgi:ADP-ribosyl-[dinitrogen reductase] hydrolase
MLLEIAIGDAYGASFEFADHDFIFQYNFASEYVENIDEKGNLTRSYGKYTDDTQMTIGTCNAIINSKSNYISSEQFIREYLKEYHRDKREGYSRRTKKLLEGNNIKDFFKDNTRRNSNGSVMRCIPLGLFKKPEVVINNATQLSLATHRHMDSINATIFISLFSHFIYYHGFDIDDFVNFIKTVHPESYHAVINSSWKKDDIVPCDALKTAKACFTILKNSFDKNKTLTDLLYESVTLGGDTDSVASIVMGLSSMDDYWINDISRELKDLKETQENLDLIYSLDFKLFNKFK